jgi:hypothetical protein
VPEVPTKDGGALENVCLRPCETQADCDPVGSVCDTLDGLVGRYCF